MYLLETSALLRAGGVINEPIGAEAQKIIESASRRIFISIVSIWELVNLDKAVKIAMEQSPELFLNNALDSLGCELLSLEMRHLSSYKKLEILTYKIPGVFTKSKKHTDPFDRMLIAQAMDEDLIVITKDEVFPLYPQIQTVW